MSYIDLSDEKKRHYRNLVWAVRDTFHTDGLDAAAELIYNNSASKPKVPRAVAKEVAEEAIMYLNERSGRRFGVSPRVVDRVHKVMEKGARMGDPLTADHFLAVIEFKVSEWKNNVKMAKYLTPDTLFKTGDADRNFFDYLEQARNAVRGGKC